MLFLRTINDQKTDKNGTKRQQKLNKGEKKIYKIEFRVRVSDM